MITTSKDVLETLGTPEQPDDVLVALGYAGWEKGQLEQEVLENAWLTIEANTDILFRTPIASRWREAGTFWVSTFAASPTTQDTPDEQPYHYRLRLRHQKHRRGRRPGVDRQRRALPAFKAQDGSPDWLKIEKLLKEWQPDLVVVGLPLNMDGTEQPVTAQARKFANRLHGRFGIQIDLHDERLSTVEARANLFDRGGFRALDKGSVDSASAVVILESWFERQLG